MKNLSKRSEVSTCKRLRHQKSAHKKLLIINRHCHRFFPIQSSLRRKVKSMNCLKTRVMLVQMFLLANWCQRSKKTLWNPPLWADKDPLKRKTLTSSRLFLYPMTPQKKKGILKGMNSEVTLSMKS